MKNEPIIKSYTLSDTPITNEEDDLLNYSPYAKKIQKLIQANTGNSDPITIGIYGEWGQGKSSFLNLIEHQIDLFQKEKGDSIVTD